MKINRTVNRIKVFVPGLPSACINIWICITIFMLRCHCWRWRHRFVCSKWLSQSVFAVFRFHGKVELTLRFDFTPHVHTHTCELSSMRSNTSISFVDSKSAKRCGKSVFEKFVQKKTSFFSEIFRLRFCMTSSNKSNKRQNHSSNEWEMDPNCVRRKCVRSKKGF